MDEKAKESYAALSIDDREYLCPYSYGRGWQAALAHRDAQVMSEDEAVEIMAKAAYEEYFRGGGKDCVWDNATSNERIIHCAEARAAYRALLAAGGVK